MDETEPERLYPLLPAVYRERDAAAGGALRALLAVLESELVVAETALDAQYANWFIETCDEQTIVRIGDLVAAGPLLAAATAAGRLRSLVANAISRRRRKGVAGALEESARDASGWPVRVVEYFQLLGMTQHIRYPHPGRGGTVSVRDMTALADIGGPFESLPTRPDVRRIASGRGRHNIPNVGLFVCRGESVTAAPAAAGPGPEPGRYTFHPLGVDSPLAVRPTASPAGSRPGPLNLPVRITRGELGRAAGQLVGRGRSIEIRADGRYLTAADITAADLGSWQAAGDRVAVDPERGRLLFPQSPPARCDVGYSYRVPGPVGGGPYDRRESPAVPPPGGRPLTVPGTAPDGYPTLAEALGAAHGPADVLTICESATVTGETVISLSADSTFVVQAADGTRPVLRAGLRVEAPADASLVLDGLLIGGRITLSGTVRLTLRHCTVRGGVTAADGGDHDLTASHSFLGPVTLAAVTRPVRIADGVIDGSSLDTEREAALRVPSADLARVTVFGSVQADELHGTDSIFTGDVAAVRRQAGSLRYCYVVPGGRTPPRFRCQPDLAMAVPGARRPEEVAQRVRPVFRSTVYGAYGYADLDPACPAEIAAGGESGTEMGAFAGRLAPQRDAALRAALAEYLPYGLEAGIIDVP